MPAKSEAQRKALFAKKGAAWVKAHGFDKLEGGAGAKHKRRKKRV